MENQAAAARFRQFFRDGETNRQSHMIRPPWTDEARVRDKCTGCGDCISACPEAILIAGPAGTPVVDFASSGCSFCGDCVKVCTEDVFIPIDQSPWTYEASIGQKCLLSAGISCQICTDFCDSSALRFDLSHRPAGKIHLNTSECTGCGACLGACPQGAITLTVPKPVANRGSSPVADRLPRVKTGNLNV